MKLPSTQSLKAFHAVAKYKSTVIAAENINLTQSAISHQIRKLEEALGIQLVRRKGRNIELTSAGSLYASKIEVALRIIDQASMNAGSNAEPHGTLCINTASGFGNRWLSEHIWKFTQRYPNISVKIFSQNVESNVHNNKIDVSILFGNRTWRDMKTQHLYAPKGFLVCSPTLIKSLNQISKPADIANLPLIHYKNYSLWEYWQQTTKAKSINIYSGIVFEDVNHCISAAIAGCGIAIGDNIIAGKGLKEGTLVRLFDDAIDLDNAYYLVTRKTSQPRIVTTAFLEWISDEFQYPDIILPNTL